MIDDRGRDERSLLTCLFDSPAEIRIGAFQHTAAEIAEAESFVEASQSVENRTPVKDVLGGKRGRFAGNRVLRPVEELRLLLRLMEYGARHEGDLRVLKRGNPGG